VKSLGQRVETFSFAGNCHAIWLLYLAAPNIATDKFHTTLTCGTLMTIFKLFFVKHSLARAVCEGTDQNGFDNAFVLPVNISEVVPFS
jgi:hypothetical protein